MRLTRRPTTPKAIGRKTAHPVAKADGQCDEPQLPDVLRPTPLARLVETPVLRMA